MFISDRESVQPNFIECDFVRKQAAAMFIIPFFVQHKTFYTNIHPYKFVSLSTCILGKRKLVKLLVSLNYNKQFLL